MDTSKSKGPGRPTVAPDAAKKNVVIRFDALQRAKIKAGGGSQWVRDLVDAAPSPETTKKKPPQGGSSLG